MQINFRINDELPRHPCTARREGDWIIFTCPQCDGYERRLNIRSGKISLSPGDDPFILHEGVFVPDSITAELGGGFASPN